MSTLPLMRPGVEVVHINDISDVENALLSMWPDKVIPAHEFHSILTPNDISTLKYHLGRNRVNYSVREMADLIWERSNYERDIDFK